jgi:hypothetical protein
MAASEVRVSTLNSSAAPPVLRPPIPPSQTAHGQNRTALLALQSAVSKALAGGKVKEELEQAKTTIAAIVNK